MGLLGRVLEKTVQKGAQAAIDVSNGAANVVLGEERKNRMAADFMTSLIKAPGAADNLMIAAAGMVQSITLKPLKRFIDGLSVALKKTPGAVDVIINATADMVKYVTPGAMGKLLNAIADAMNLLEAQVLLGSLIKITRTVTTAILKDAKYVFTIKEGVFSNPLTAATIQFLWNQRHTVTNFTIDVIECAKCYVKADSTTGERDPREEHGQDNELDLSDPMNRHALLCQVQRLVKSIVFILTNVANPLPFDQIDMTRETRLCTDIVDLGSTIEVTPSGRQNKMAISEVSIKDERRDSAVEELPNGHTAGNNKKAGKAVNGNPANGQQHEPSPNYATPGYQGGQDPAAVTDEKWFFVNGIGTELYWLHLACRKLAKRYSRDVTGVYNRGDGILWDLIECAGQRNGRDQLSTASQTRMVQTTSSGQAAQRELSDQLEAALLRGGAYKKVVMIAHSQGCLVLRLALDSLRARRSAPLDEAMRERLCVFTFGNPSVDWFGEPDGEPDGVLRTEHFANDRDFVAHLGVFHDDKPKERGFTNVFVNKEEGWVGHLFGAQYSLHRKHYTDEFGKRKSQRSWLLNCREGESLTAASRRIQG